MVILTARLSRCNHLFYGKCIKVYRKGKANISPALPWQRKLNLISVNYSIGTGKETKLKVETGT